MENLTKEAGREIQALRERGSRRGTLLEVSRPCGGSGGIPHRKVFEIEILGFRHLEAKRARYNVLLFYNLGVRPTPLPPYIAIYPRGDIVTYLDILSEVCHFPAC